MKKGEGYLSKENTFVLNKILQELKNSPNGPKQFLQKNIINNHGHMHSFAKEEIPEELKVYTTEEAKVGRFASLVHLNSEVYVIKYLNCLIHNILTATEVFRKYMVMSIEEYKT